MHSVLAILPIVPPLAETTVDVTLGPSGAFLASLVAEEAEGSGEVVGAVPLDGANVPPVLWATPFIPGISAGAVVADALPVVPGETPGVGLEPVPGALPDGVCPSPDAAGAWFAGPIVSDPAGFGTPGSAASNGAEVSAMLAGREVRPLPVDRPDQQESGAALVRSPAATLTSVALSLPQELSPVPDARPAPAGKTPGHRVVWREQVSASVPDDGAAATRPEPGHKGATVAMPVEGAQTLEDAVDPSGASRSTSRGDAGPARLADQLASLPELSGRETPGPAGEAEAEFDGVDPEVAAIGAGASPDAAPVVADAARAMWREVGSVRENSMVPQVIARPGGDPLPRAAPESDLDARRATLVATTPARGFWERLYAGLGASDMAGAGPLPVRMAAVLGERPAEPEAEEAELGRVMPKTGGIGVEIPVPVAGRVDLAERANSPASAPGGSNFTTGGAAGEVVSGDVLPDEIALAFATPLSAPLTGHAPPVVAGPVAPPVPQVAAQITAALLRSDNGVTELTLSPNELGHVRLRLEPDAAHPDRMLVMMTFERPETLDLFRRHAGELAEALRAAGYVGADIGFGQDGRGTPGSGPQQSFTGGTAADRPDPAAAPATAPRLLAGASLDLRL